MGGGGALPLGPLALVGEDVVRGNEPPEVGGRGGRRVQVGVERLGARGQHDTARSPVFGASEVALPWYPCLIRGVYTTQMGRWKAATLAAGKTLAL